MQDFIIMVDLEVTGMCLDRLPLTALLVFTCFVGNMGRARSDEDRDAFFEKEIRPVLVESCQGCHGEKKQAGGLRLDSRAAILAGANSGAVVISGKSESSPLIRAIRYKSDVKMPPKGSLPETTVAHFVRWVELGLPWPASKTPAKPESSGSKHWAFQRVRNTPPPAVQREVQVRTPIDRFIFAKLEAEGIASSPRADRRSLIRRAYYDVTGLPPSPEEVEKFVRDDSPTAYSQLIDRLLESRQYGEHWGRHWLDVARYSDAKGYCYAREERFWIHAWNYRDWVIQSLNADLPYDRFIGLQLAADQLAPNDRSAQAAMGFLTLGRRFLGVSQDIIDDRIDVTTRGLLGLTVTCARCHDHKYDPIPTADYYALSGVFRSSEERVIPITSPGLAEGAIAGTGIMHASWITLQTKQKKLYDLMATRKKEATKRAVQRVGDYLHAQLNLENFPEEGFDQILSNHDLIPGIVRRWRDRIARPDDAVFLAWNHYAKLSKEEFAGAKAGPPAGNAIVVKKFATPPRDMPEVVDRYTELLTTIDAKWQSVKTTNPNGLADPAEDEIRRVIDGPNSPCEPPGDTIVDLENYLPSGVVDELWKLQVDVDRYLIGKPTIAHTVVLQDRTMPTNARIFRRGNPATPTEFVNRQFLKVLSPENRQPFRKGSGRLELANSITDPENPLTARVMVNRVWMHHFGAGLVRTTSDFGTRADEPSHPELLDWLARDFMANGWKLKSLHRQILLSATYQQSSIGPADQAIRERATSRDPENRWLWRGPIRRLSFEELRDSLFATTGELDLRVGGKAVDLTTRPFTPRRAVYGLIDRQYLPGLFRTFDLANPDLHSPQRSETTVPQQALFFMNHPFVLDRAAALAKHPKVAKAEKPEDKVLQLYRLVYQREPSPTQMRAALGLIHAIDSDSQTKSQLGAWGQLAQTLLMTNEFLFID